MEGSASFRLPAATAPLQVPSHEAGGGREKSKGAREARVMSRRGRM